MSRDLFPRLLDGMPPRYAVDAAATPAEALAMAETTQYDGLIIDINLGTDRDGVDVLQALRERPEYAEAPMMACTAYALPGDAERYLEAGFDAYLAKPFRAEDLKEALRALFDRDPHG